LLNSFTFHGQVGWMPRLVGGEGGNGLQHWSQSRPCNQIYISRKPRPVGGELHFPLNHSNHICYKLKILNNIPYALDRQVPLDPALEGGVKGHNIKGKYLTGQSHPLGR
jgi:hypothetical protein